MVAEADQLPDKIQPFGAVLVKSQTRAKWLAFDCPCGSGHRLVLNLDVDRRPCWTVASTAPLTVWPSVDVDTPLRRCHYVIRHGHVEWVPDVFSRGADDRTVLPKWRST